MLSSEEELLGRNAQKKSERGMSRRKSRGSAWAVPLREQKIHRWNVVLAAVLAAVIAVALVSQMVRDVEESSNGAGLSEEVIGYTGTIEKYAREYGMQAYVPLIQAVMMQESRGQTTDPMQSSECNFNKKYSNSPGAIEDPEYSIDVGIQYLNACLDEAKCGGPKDIEHIRLALQGYNYGNGYIAWALEKDGGYTQENAREFSEMMRQKLGERVYGDPEYAAHVLRYYVY